MSYQVYWETTPYLNLSGLDFKLILIIVSKKLSKYQTLQSQYIKRSSQKQLQQNF